MGGFKLARFRFRSCKKIFTSFFRLDILKKLFSHTSIWNFQFSDAIGPARRFFQAPKISQQTKISIFNKKISGAKCDKTV